MNLKVLSILLLPILLGACASLHPGAMGVPADTERLLPLRVSADTIDAKSDEPWQIFELTIENTSDQWVKINEARVVIHSPAQSKVSVVLGKDLKDWAEAMHFRQQKDAQNDKIMQIGLMAAGAVAALASGKSDGLAAVGVTAMAAGAGWAGADSVRASYRAAEGVDKLPETHLYQPFSVPGGMYLRKWVLLNKPAKTMIRKLVLSFETVEGEKGIYEINL